MRRGNPRASTAPFGRRKFTDMKAVTLIGDSIRIGYQDAVRRLLAGRAEVWGPTENGGTSQNVLAHLDEWVVALNPDVVHVNCGLHDLRREFGQTESAIPLKQYVANVRAILTRLRSETQAAVVWASTTPVNEEWHHRNKSFDRFEADVVAYNSAAGQVAREVGVPVNDLFAVVPPKDRDTLLQPDGVHFKPAGYALLGESVAKFIIDVCANQAQPTGSGSRATRSA